MAHLVLLVYYPRLEDNLGEPALPSLEKRRLWEGLITGFQYLKMACKRDGMAFYTDRWQQDKGEPFKTKRGDI